ncbi:hypothetical protein CHS0354_010327 [Potamilus streckersoni]|uniref:Cyclic nucleotide-binding domain-containing protein n=1 Tax=Potamilus streckersoni TaxID=2493646 RepID=A0AAE0TDM4_9BIVA|nr:hypothetical protein CHS0354_010327 [Potamilus streckersoni]
MHFRFWETLAYLANTLIFIIVGMVIAEKAIFEIHGIDWFYMFSLYFGLFVIRGLVIAIFSPILRHTGYGMSWKEGIVMTWGGLRGAVGLALALQVAHNDTIDQETVGVRVLIHVSGIVFLTLIVNATTVYGLLKLLGMSDLSPAKRMAMANALRYLEDMREKTLNMLKTDRFLADADWATVEKTSEIPDPYMTTEEEADVDESLDFKENAVCPDCDHELPPQYTRKDLRDMTNEAILRMLKAEKMSYWRQFEQGMLSREATRKLQECTDVASDKKGRSIDVEDIKKCWEVPKIQVKLKRLVKKFIVVNVVDVPKSSLLQPFHKLVNHQAFYYTIFVIIVIDMINSAISVASLYVHVLYQERDVFRSLNVFFVVVYIIEAVIKRLVQKKDYMQNPWNVISLVIISLGLIDVILSFTLPAVYGESNDTINVVLLVFILQRFSRIFRLVQPLMPIILNLIKRRMSQHLSYGFDVGRGYAAGEEEVRKLIDHMVDHKEIAKSLKQMSDNGRLEVIRCLGMLSKQHPDIALSIKTRQAIRSVLNQVRDGIHELMEDGILEEAEGAKLEKIVEEKMKRLLNAPPSLPIPAPDKMLNNVFWLQKDPELIAYIKDKAKLLSYNFDDVIMKQGDPPGGIYIIVSGMVRLESSSTSGKQKVSFQDKPSESTKQNESDLLDFLMSGNIIGEMGLLTRKPRSATVVCETSVQVLFISLEDMVHAMEKFSGGEEPLEYRLWHVCANRIAVNILTNQPTYQGWTKEKIKLRLENSYLANLDNNVFAVDSSMSDVVLVNGQAINPFTEELFEGPCYVPWTVFKLDILPNQKPKCVILVIPSELGQPVHSHSKVSHEDQRGHGAFINTISKLCLRHASQHRLNLESKWRKVQMAKSMGTLFSMQKISAEETSGSRNQFSNGLVGDGYPLGPRASTPGRLQRSYCNDAFLEEEEEEEEEAGEVESTTGSDSIMATSVSALQVAVTSSSRSMGNEYVTMPGSNSNANNNTNIPIKPDHSLDMSASKSRKKAKDSCSLNQEVDLVEVNEQFQNHSPLLEIVREENEAQTMETKGAKTNALKRVSDPSSNFSNRRSPESTQIFGWETQYWKQFLSTSAKSPTGSLTSTSSKSSLNDKGTFKTKDQNDTSMTSGKNNNSKTHL